MSDSVQLDERERDTISSVRALANQAFSRAAGAPLIEGNSVRLLRDARENYPAWLAAIGTAKRHIHLESYIIYDDEAGWMFADALVAKAREGVRVRLIYDWMGGVGKTSRAFWNHLRAGGVEVRCYNPPRLDSPLGWVSRDHRKMLAVDGHVGFVTGLCIGRMWVGVPEKKIDPWRDTGIEVRGPSVADIERAFAQVWAMMGEPIPEHELMSRSAIAPEGDVRLRVVASMPATAGLFRLDQLVAALATHRLWLTDAYYAGMNAYIQGLRAAAMDGVDVRLLVPNGTDIPILRPLSRVGYRPLLEAGVRVFEWNGTMMHAKTAVADSKWGRVGSTNLNIASWLGNCELDVVIEDEPFARLMEEMYLQDLQNATEVVLDAAHKVRAPNEPRHPSPVLTSGGGSVGRAAAGAIRIGNAVGAAFTNRRVLEPIEARIMVTVGVLLLALGILFAFLPRLLAYPIILVLVWIAVSLLYRGYKLHRRKSLREKVEQDTAETVKGKRGPMSDRRVSLLIAALLYFLLTSCLVATSEVTPEGQDQSRVAIAVPLDRPFVFSSPGKFTQAGFLHAQVVSVHDGGTLTVLLDGQHEKVRLIGIDPPELDQPLWGVQARDVLKALVADKTVRLETDVTKRDQYKRLLAYVYVGDLFVNAEIIRQGQAVPHIVPPNVAHVEDYRKAQQEAREAGRGVWNKAQPLDVAPDRYRK